MYSTIVYVRFTLCNCFKYICINEYLGLRNNMKGKVDLTGSCGVEVAG
jgi:hypothetical protein